MNNKVLIHLLLPEIDESYDVYIPINVRIGTINELFARTFKDKLYVRKENKERRIYNLENSSPYEVNLLVRETNIRNATVVLFV